MEGYIKSVLKKYEHPLPSKPQHALHKHCEITYGAKLQLIPNTKTYPALDIAGIQRVQGIVGAILYYRPAVDNKILVTFSEIGTQQARATEATATATRVHVPFSSSFFLCPKRNRNSLTEEITEEFLFFDRNYFHRGTIYWHQKGK